MKKFDIFTRMALFRGIEAGEMGELFACLDGIERTYEREEFILHMGQVVRAMGLVISGSVNIMHGDVWGNLHIIDHVGPGQSFAETYACVPGEILMVDVVATEPSRVLFLDVGKMLDPCQPSCPRHSRLIQNLLTVMASKNLVLTRKMTHIAPKSIRERLLSYLSFQALQRGSHDFEIPFNRQQLADYLSVERSALSNELSKMRRDGLIEFYKSHFTLLTQKGN